MFPAYIGYTLYPSLFRFLARRVQDCQGNGKTGLPHKLSWNHPRFSRGVLYHLRLLHTYPRHKARYPVHLSLFLRPLPCCKDKWIHIVSCASCMPTTTPSGQPPFPRPSHIYPTFFLWPVLKRPRAKGGKHESLCVHKPFENCILYIRCFRCVLYRLCFTHILKASVVLQSSFSSRPLVLSEETTY